MSAHKSIDAIQVELHHPSLDEMNPINTEPLLQTLAHGEIPSNYQINDSIDRLKQSIDETKERAHLNEKGERLVQDVENLLETAKHLVNERNEGESIQNLLRDSKDAVSGAAHDAAKQASALGHDIRGSLPHIPSKTELVLGALPAVAENLPGALSHLPNIASLNLDDIKSLINSVSTGVEFNFPTEEAQQIGGDAKSAYNLLKEIALYSARSKEFRELLGEFIDFFHGTFGDLSGKLAEVGQAAMMDIDSKDPTLSNTRDVAMKDVAAAKDTHPIELTDAARKEAYAKFSKLLQKISEKPEYKKLSELWWKYMDEIKEKMDDVAHKAATKASELKDAAAEKGAQLKDKAEELKDKAEDKASGVADMVIEKGTEIKDQVKETAMELKDDASKRAGKVLDKNADSFDKVWNDVRDVVDNFGGKGTFDSFYVQSYNFYARMYNDKAARRYLHDLRTFSAAAIQNPKTLASQETANNGMELITRGRKLIQSERYAIMYNKYFHSWHKLLNNFSNDTLVNDFREQLRKFAADFALDSKGRPDIYALQESLGQIKSFIYPILMKQLENMTVAKINGASDSYDWSIEHLSVGIANFVPESFDLRTKNHLKMNVKDMEAAQNNTRVVLDIHSLKPHFNDVKFWYRRKSFPHIEDSGVVDIDLSAGEGTRIKIIWKIKSKHNRPYAFSLMEVKCVVDKIDIKIKNAQHDILDRIAASVFMAGIKHEIANGIVNAIVDVLHPINDSMNKWFATRPIGSITDKLNEKVHEALDDAAKKANEAIKNHPVDKITDTVMEGIEYAKEAIEDKMHDVVATGEAVVESASAVKDAASVLKRKALSEENPGLREIKDKAVELKDAAVEKGSELASKVKENIPTDLEDAKKKAGQLKDAAVEKGQEVVDAAKEKYPEAAKKAEQLKDAAVEKGTQVANKAGELKDKAVEKGSELASKAKDNMPADVEDAKKKAGELKDAAVDKAGQLKDAAVEKGTQAANKAGELKDKAVEKGTEAANKAGELKDKAVEKGTEVANKAVEKGTEAANKAVEKGSELKDKAEDKALEVKDAARGAASYAAVASGSEQPVKARAAANKEGKWHSKWEKPSKTAKPKTVEKITITETREVVMEDKIVNNPYEALSEESLETLKKKAQ